MATYSVNQARQVYVATSLKDSALISTDPVGSIVVGGTMNECLYFMQKGLGGDVTTDIIKLDTIDWAKATEAEELATKLKRVLVTLDANINGGAPVGGQDYILRILFKGYHSDSADNYGYKFAQVHATTGMVASDFYKAMAKQIILNLPKSGPSLTIYLKTADSETEVTSSTQDSTLTGTYTGIIVEAAPGTWHLGTYPQKAASFEVQSDKIVFSGDEVQWASVEDQTPTKTMKDGPKMADLEYFYMGERSGVERGLAFPYGIISKYMVDPAKEYNVIDIHFYYQGSNEAVQKSEKDLLLIVLAEGADKATKNKLTNDILAKIKTVTGLDIPALHTA